MYRYCCHCPHFYRFLPVLRRLIAFAECVLGIMRLLLFFSPIPNKSSSEQKYKSMYIAAFTIDWISSIVPTCMTFFIAVLILVILLKLLICCYKNCTNLTCLSFLDDVDTEKWFRGLVKSRATNRWIVMDCNCPCYELRPKLRFRIRCYLLFFILILRMIATSLYVGSAQGDNRGADLANMSSISILLLIFTILLDLYRYCVWWHYTPYNDTTCCCCRSSKHVRYIPYILFNRNHSERLWDEDECVGDSCSNHTLEHVAIFHHSGYPSQPRWNIFHNSYSPLYPNNQICSAPTYIGFHQTSPENAMKIVRNEFLPSSSGMLGPGTYFARTCDATTVKVGGRGGHGAWFIAEIDMGKVYGIEKRLIDCSPGNLAYNSTLRDYISRGSWHLNHDTCYSMHYNENFDEFCIKDPKRQILRWVIIIDEDWDEKVKLCRMDSEFDSTRLECV